MQDIGANKAALFFGSRICCSIDLPRGRGGIVVVVTPFCEVVCKFEARCVSGSVLEVDHDELFVLVSGQ